MIVPVILSGGEGKRLWPLSRQFYPKQLQNLFLNHSLLQQTILRINHFSDCTDPIIITNKNYRFILEQQLSEINCVPSQLILEPQALNTTFAVALAALWAKEKLHNPLLLVLPVDHMMSDQESFLQAIMHAKTYLDTVNPNLSVLFATKPTYASSHFGYIKGKPLDANLLKVEEFIEKPKKQRAARLIKTGQYYWNTGIFLFYTDHILAELTRFASPILDFAKHAYASAQKELHTLNITDANLSECPNISIDYSIFEKTQNIIAAPFAGEWIDVGNWTTLYQASTKDAEGNVKIGDVETINTTGCYVRGSTRLIATIGIKDQTIVDTPDALLIIDNQKAHEVTNLVNKLVSQNRRETKYYPHVIKPWGSFEILYFDPHVQIKRLKINPGACLSTQLHKSRSEHWIVVSGQASVLKDSRTMTLLASQSTYIPVGIKHRLANETNEPLEIIEVQLGNYLDDDDIIRYEDKYARSPNEM